MNNILQNRLKSRRYSIYIFLFQLCVIADSVLGDDPNFFVISKGIMLTFFVSVIILIIKNGWKIQLNHSLLLPYLFFIFMTISLVWSANKSLAFAQYVTEIQLFVLFLFIFYYMKKEGKIEDYLYSLYISGFLLALYALYKYKGISGYMTLMLSGSRLGGEISNENTFGLVFANACLIALYLAIMKEKKRIFFFSF